MFLIFMYKSKTPYIYDLVRKHPFENDLVVHEELILFPSIEAILHGREGGFSTVNRVHGGPVCICIWHFCSKNNKEIKAIGVSFLALVYQSGPYSFYLQQEKVDRLLGIQGT